MKIFRIAVVCCLISMFELFSLTVSALPPSPLTIRLQPFLSGLSLPVYLTNAKDGSKRVFIVQQRGVIKVVQPGATAPTDFINLSTKVSQSGTERGLLGLAFHPQFSVNRRFFVYYTRVSDGAIEIAEYKTFAGNPNQGDIGTERVIITIPHTLAANHNGGTIEFGADGYLYAGTGDGGSANDPQNNAQNINSLLGKILRIDIDPPAGVTAPYSSPGDNPYAGATAGADEIYAIGMRNPYRWSFDRGGTRRLWVGDVGQDAIEEVDIINKGENYGWRVYEGTRCTNNDPNQCAGGGNPLSSTPPIFQYNSAAPEPRCAVTGGYVYRGTQNTLPEGAYLYGDYCTGEILLWNNNQQTLLLDSPRNISSFGEDENGELYVVGLGGTVEKVVRAKASADFDGDFNTDISVFRPNTGVWYGLNSSDGTVKIQSLGLNGDVPAPEDYDGDNIKDIGVFRPSTGVWYYIRSSDNTIVITNYGINGDIPAAGDYDGDAKADLAVFRPSTGTWWIRRTTNPNNSLAVSFGAAGDKPVQGDYDGDGIYDIAVWRPSNGVWYILNSSNNSVTFVGFGLNGDIPAQGDYDGDGRNDQAVFRPSTGVWYVLQSAGGFLAVQWGINNDIPAVGDYDGDAKEDIAVFRPSTGVWYVLRSSNSSALIAPFGLNGDLPAPAYDAP